jgi:murein L,D-transpeptidase YcbB/YkuD
VPVRTVYETAWVDARGRAHFRDDVYGEDARMVATVPHTPRAGRSSLTAAAP